MELRDEVIRSACNHGIPVVSASDKFVSVVRRAANRMSGIERQYFRVAIGAKRNAIGESIGTTVRLGHDMVTLDARVLALVAKTTVALTCNRGFQACERRRENGSKRAV